MTYGFNRPAVRELGDGERWELVEPLEFCLLVGHGHIVVTVPKGFVTNYASVPCLLRGIFPPQGKWNRAAILHDYLYSHPGNASRFYVDCTFCEAMAALGVPWYRRVPMFIAVLFFGWLFWNGGDV
jgi:hypothetical protein